MEETKAEDKPLEKSPQERYVRFGTRLGSGAYKTVYKAYDTDQGIDVAWNAIDIASLPTGEKSRIIQEVQLLQKLEHKNIINFYGSWFSKEKNQVVFITEIMTSGTLKSYIKRVQFVKWKIIKRWCIQILEGLEYLHSQDPPIIHRDLKCDNIFINGNTGDLRIGDLGLSTQMAVEQRAQSVLGTPEFMAPELYDENYDEKVDIYAFGMCVLEMVTKEVPYSECMNPAQIYKKVIAGIRPQGLQRIISDSARNFIELCLSRGDGKVDVTAAYLLQHPFLQPSENDDDHDLVYPVDEPMECKVPAEPEPSNEELQKELDMEDKNKDDFVDRKMSVPNMTIETDPNSGTTQLAYNAPEVKVDVVENDTTPVEKQPAIETTEISEPISGEVTDDHMADEILASMPGNEANVQDNRIDIMDGRRQRRVKSERMEDDKEKAPIAEKKTVSMVEPSRAQHKPLREHASSVPDLENMPPRPRIPRTEEELKSVEKIESQSKMSEFVDEGRGTDEMVIRKRGNRHDIRATEDPEHEYSIILNLRIVIDGKTKEIKFPFNLFTDVPHEVASELAADVGISEPDLADIIDSIAFLVTEGKIKNLEKMDFDVWEDSPEPYSFVKKGTSINPVAVAKRKEGAPLDPNPSPPPVPSNVIRSVSANATSSDGSSVGTGRSSMPEISRDDAAAVAAAALMQGVPPPNGLHSNSRISNANSVNGSPPPDSFEIEEANADLVRSFEGRLQIAQSAFDQREMSLEAAIRSEEEKHKREMERYKKKMEEFERKKQKAALARMQRMEQVTAEFKAEVVAERKRRPQGLAPEVPNSVSSVPGNSESTAAPTSAVVSAPPTMQQPS